MEMPVFCESCGKVSIAGADHNGEFPCLSCGHVLAIPSHYDVFISYATPQLAIATQMGAALKEAGISYWLARERIDVGEDFRMAITHALETAKVVVLVLSAAAVESPWVQAEITVAFSSKKPFFPLKVEEFKLPREFDLLLKLRQWKEVFHQPFETYVDGIVSRVQTELRALTAKKVAPSAPAPTPVEPPKLLGVNPNVSPYVGPRPFPSRMANRFFGREPEAKAILHNLAESRILLVYAPSGAGKSSLLNTLVSQTLESEAVEVLLGARVGGALPVGVKASDIRNIFTFSIVYGLDNTAAPNPQCRLHECLSAMSRKPDTRGRVIILDQFEELFTQHVERFEDRAAFFEELVQAMEVDPTLRAVLAIRQEYLADIEPLAGRMPAELKMRYFALKRLDTDGALEAIIRPAAPYATFAQGVAEDIVKQLNTICVTGFDGSVVKKRGEFIEMVHLQIVCERLWTSLPSGITCIDKSHLDRAAGEGTRFEDFVVNALDAFYDATVDRVAESALTKEHGGYPKELIRLGCMKFVTMSSTRTLVQQSHGRTGRLPDWIVQQLEGFHLLRSEQRGGARWYELSHDRLAEPVGRQMSRKVSELLFAADLLDKVLEKVLRERGGHLRGYFEQHRDILKECHPFASQPGMFPDEAEFVFRASLVAGGEESIQWSRRLKHDYPQVRLDVMREAMTCESVQVRSNAAWLMGHEPDAELETNLIQLALEDNDEDVRYAAAKALAQLDKPELYRPIVETLNRPDSRSRGLSTLSLIKIVADSTPNGLSFDSTYDRLDGSAHRAVKWRSRGIRLREGLATLLYIFIPAAILSATSATMFKWLPGMFDMALCQERAGAGKGAFHGLTAGVVWGGLIPLGIAFYRVVFSNERRPGSYLRPTGALVSGAIFGALTGAIVAFIVVSVFTVDALRQMGWIVSQVRFSPEFWSDLLVQYRLGWSYIITGMGLGIAMGLMTNGLRASPAWGEFVARQTRLTSFKQTLRVIRQAAGIVVRHAWPLPAMLLIAGLIAFAVQNPPPPVSPEFAWKVSAEGRAKGTFADCATQAFGGFFAIVGTGLGMVIMRHGLQVTPRKD